MAISTVFKKIARHFISESQAVWYSRPQPKFKQDLSLTQAMARFQSRNELHAYMHHYFYNMCPSDLREHRVYYKKDGRAFGEDAFHILWFMLLREFRPFRCLEIGVYRGQVISLWALIAKKLNFLCEIHGISPFTPAGDQVSVYLKSINYQQDILMHHRHFDLPLPTLFSAFSTDSDAVEYIRAKRWDLIYIDGGHDYDVVLADYQNCYDSLAEGGLLVMDDSSLYTNYKPPLFSFAGHPGPSKVAQELAMRDLIFIGAIGHNNIFMKKTGR